MFPVLAEKYNLFLSSQPARYQIYFFICLLNISTLATDVLELLFTKPNPLKETISNLGYVYMISEVFHFKD